MSKFIWKIKCVYYFRILGKLPFSHCWYLATAAQEVDDWDWYTPKEAVLNEFSYWDF